jgi:hypothetical protein
MYFWITFRLHFNITINGELLVLLKSRITFAA